MKPFLSIRPKRIVMLAFMIAVTIPASAQGDQSNPTYDDDIVPILRQHCNGCHNAEKQRGGLDITSYAALKAGGSSGEVMIPGNPDKSRLYTLTAHTEEPKMPPNSNKIDQAKIDLIRLWIEQGGRENRGSKVVAVKPKIDLTLKMANRGKPDGPPPMPTLGKLSLEPTVVARRPNAVLALATSPWAPLVAIGGQRQILFYHSETGELLGVLPFEHGQINTVKFSRNGKLLLAAGGRGGASGKAVLYDVQTGQRLTEVGDMETDAILDADLSPNQSAIAVGTPGKIVRIYNTADGSVLHTIKKHTDWVTAVEYSPDGVLLATGDRSNGLIVWEAETAREFYTLIGHQKMITDLCWRADSNVLASSSEDGTIKLWDMLTGNLLKSWNAHGGGALSVTFSNDGRVATTGRDRVTKLWDANGNLQKQFDALPDLGLKVAVTHDNSRVIAGDWSGMVRSWLMADGQVLGTLDANPPPLAQRLKQIESQVTTLEAQSQQAAAALAAAVANADRARQALEAARKAVTDTAKAAAEATAAVPVKKMELDKAAVAVMQAEAVLKMKEDEVVKRMTEAKNRADAAAKDPNQATAAQAAQEALMKAVADRDSARTMLQAAQAAMKTAADNYALAQKAASAAAQAAAEAPKQVPALEKAANDAANAIAAAKAAADKATANLTAAKTQFDRLKAIATTKQ
jgi:DNA-binding beta-propeller fold protein YncE